MFQSYKVRLLLLNQVLGLAHELFIREALHQEQDTTHTLRLRLRVDIPIRNKRSTWVKSTHFHTSVSAPRASAPRPNPMMSFCFVTL